MDTTPTSPRRPTRTDTGLAPAFTLTELLIVIGLIVLVIALAVPAFRAMSGGRSIDAAQNQLSAVLGAARAEAIGLQKVRGVFFYVDPATERVNAALVQEVSYTPERPPTNPPDLYIDLVPDRDPVALPVGVGLQGIDNSEVVPGATPERRDDGYIGFNLLAGVAPAPQTEVRFGGVILFDGYGRVVNKFYGFHFGEQIDPKKRRPNRATRLAEALGIAAGSDIQEHYIPEQRLGSGSALDKQPAQSLFGFVLYDAEAFRATVQGLDAADKYVGDLDPQFAGGGYAQKEKDEEVWLDKNAAPILINRYNGTLIRGE